MRKSVGGWNWVRIANPNPNWYLDREHPWIDPWYAREAGFALIVGIALLGFACIVFGTLAGAIFGVGVL
jgi:hypothetical protein